MSNPEPDTIAVPGTVIPQDALYEIRNVQQVSGEPTRRWFFSHEMDLIVWFDGEDQPISFQLSYDKHRRIERTIRWKPGLGFSHHRVDDSLTGNEDLAPNPSGSALLVPDGAFDATKVRARFLALSPAMPWAITQYVADRLLAHPEHRSWDSIRKPLILAAVIAIPLAMILAYLKSSRAGSRRHQD